jgi:hypothetical protein
MPEPYDDYLVSLRDAADLYATDEVQGQSAALAATLTFLGAMNVELRLTTPLQAVWGHLAETERTSNAAKPVMDSLNMAAMAAVITLAMRAGHKLQDAAKLVAKETGIGEHYPQSVRQLLQFRKNLMDKRESPAAQRQYDLMTSKSDRSPQEVLQRGLEFLRSKMTGTSLR